VAAFDGGRVCTDGGALLLKRTDDALGLLDRLARCFSDGRQTGSIHRSVRSMRAQRIFGLAVGYEDFKDYERPRTDAVFGVLAGKLDEPLAGKSTLNRLELFPRRGLSRYHRIRPDGEAIERLFVKLFFDSYRSVPAEIVLDLDATDVPLHGEQERRFFHSYYDHYRHLPLYVFCGRQPLMERLRPSNIDGAAGALEAVEQLVGQVRARCARTRIVLRADSGFAREALMGWCERHGVEYVLGLARNARLVRAIGRELREAAAEARRSSRPAKCTFRENQTNPRAAHSCRPTWQRMLGVHRQVEQHGVAALDSGIARRAVQVECVPPRPSSASGGILRR
jgi:hypothetical protein